MMDRCPHAGLPFSPNTTAFRPAGGNINRGQGVQEETINTISAIIRLKDQVNLQETKTVILPIRKGTDGNHIL
jgi:hypothetical protein